MLVICIHIFVDNEVFNISWHHVCGHNRWNQPKKMMYFSSIWISLSTLEIRRGKLCFLIYVIYAKYVICNMVLDDYGLCTKLFNGHTHTQSAFSAPIWKRIANSENIKSQMNWPNGSTWRLSAPWAKELYGTLLDLTWLIIVIMAHHKNATSKRFDRRRKNNCIWTEEMECERM